jgi:hypothetical protein
MALQQAPLQVFYIEIQRLSMLIVVTVIQGMLVVSARLAIIWITRVVVQSWMVFRMQIAAATSTSMNAPAVHALSIHRVQNRSIT